MVMNRYIKSLLMLAFCSAQTVTARVVLPDILSSGMVVQRGEDVSLWGKADPGENVLARCGKKSVSTVADCDGNWSLKLPALKAGGPYVVHVNDIELDDVLSGDVFVCSGQSNMELPVNRVLDMFADDVAMYADEHVRQFMVDKQFSFDANESDSQGHWCKADPVAALNFSALGYFFARELHAATGVPVAIINASWGGTPIEAWMSKEYLSDDPMALAQLKIYDDETYRDDIKRLESKNYARWNATLYLMDKGISGDVKWFDCQLDTSDWTAVVIPGGYGSSRSSWGSDGLNPVNGSHWFRKTVQIPAGEAGKDAVLRLGCIVDADSVYFNGEYVGSTGYQYPPRVYKVPGRLVRKGDNQLTVRVISQNGYPQFVPEKPYKLVFDDNEISLEGEWKYRLGAVMPSGPGMQFYCYVPTVLYNKMIAPIVKYPVCGAVWYQGESNVGRRNQYDRQLVNLIDNWRRAWNDRDMPFYVVELADFLHPSDKGGRQAWAEMRQRQAKAVSDTHHAWLIGNSDLGEWNDIHPLDKKTLGQRVARQVLENINKK